jgi:hypothetical protein
MDVPWIYFAPGIDDADQRLIEIVITKTHRAVQGTRICAGNTFENASAFHTKFPLGAAAKTGVTIPSASAQ